MGHINDFAAFSLNESKEEKKTTAIKFEYEKNYAKFQYQYQ